LKKNFEKKRRMTGKIYLRLITKKQQQEMKKKTLKKTEKN